MRQLYRTYLFIGFLAGVTALLGYLYLNKPETPELPQPQQAVITTPQASRSPEEQLTSEQKVAQLLAVPLDITAQDSSLSAAFALTEQLRPGFAVLFGSTISLAQAQAATARLDQSFENYPLGISLATDHEGGTVQRLAGSGFTRLPSWQRSCSASVGTQQDQFGAAASELKTVGIDVVFAPVVDIATSSGVLGSRGCSDATDILETAKAYITALQKENIKPVIKHFPGIGRVRVDTHSQFATVTPTLLESSMFTILLDNFPGLAVMTAHVGVSTQNPDVPCTLATECVSAVTTNFPDSLVFSDALEMKSALYRPAPLAPKPLQQVAKEALEAGVDVLVFGPEVPAKTLEQLHQFLVLEYDQSPEFARTVEARFAKVLNYKQKAGMIQEVRP